MEALQHDPRNTLPPLRRHRLIARLVLTGLRADLHRPRRAGKACAGGAGAL